MIALIIKGLILGFSVAAPVGPIGIICINRTLKRGIIFGVISGLGAAAADTIYGIIAGLGLTTITSFLTGNAQAIKIIGCIALIYMGGKQIISNVKTQGPSTDDKAESNLKAFLSVFFLTVTNPMTILFFLAVLTGMGINVGLNDIGLLIAFLVAVFLGSAAWWITLCVIVGKIRHRLESKITLWINRASGAIILTFGVIGLIQ